MTKKQGRAIAAYMFPITTTQCEICGKRKRLERHHKDFDPTHNVRRNIAFVCRACHAKVHVRRGDWGNTGKTCLTTQQVRLIRDHSLVYSSEDIAKEFGLSGRYVRYIRAGERLTR